MIDHILEVVSTSDFAFFLLQLINVILSTIKSIATIKGKKISAALWNALYFGYYTFVIKAISDASFSILEINPIIIAAIITIITNLLGVYIGRLIIDKAKKDKLWLVKVTMHSDEYSAFVNELFLNKIPFVRISTQWHKLEAADIYLYNKDQSRTLKKIMENYKSIKYCYMETEVSL